MAPKPSAPTAAPKSGAFERVRLEPLPEHMYEEITAEQLVIDVAALSDLTEDEVRQTGVQSNLVALHLCGNVPEHRQDLLRLAQGLTMIRPTADPPVANASATGPAAIDDALGINVFFDWHCGLCICRGRNACIRRCRKMLPACSECNCAE